MSGSRRCNIYMYLGTLSLTQATQKLQPLSPDVASWNQFVRSHEKRSIGLRLSQVFVWTGAGPAPRYEETQLDEQMLKAEAVFHLFHACCRGCRFWGQQLAITGRQTQMPLEYIGERSKIYLR